MDMPARNSAEVPALTGIRGLAAFFVVLYHVHEYDYLGAGPCAVLMRHGYLAVDLFFVLSGFVMALSYQKLFEFGFTLNNYCVFLIRRFARIYPLYSAATLLLIGVSWWFGHPPRPRQIALNLALVDGWGISSPIDGPSWSVSTEVAAYLAFPLLAALTLYRKPALAISVAIVSFAALTAVSTVATPPWYAYTRQGPLDISWIRAPWPLLRCITEFTLGLVAFRMCRMPRLRAIWSRSWFTSSVALAVVCLLCLHGPDLIVVALLPLLLAGLLHSTSIVGQILASAPSVLLGRLSYSMYLIHYPLLRIRGTADVQLRPYLGAAGADLTALALFYLTLIAACWLCFKLLEEPGRRLIRSFEKKLFPLEDARLRQGEAEQVSLATASTD